MAVATAATTGLKAVRSGCAASTASVARSATNADTRGSASAAPARMESPSGVSKLYRDSMSTTPRTVRATPTTRSVEETSARARRDVGAMAGRSRSRGTGPALHTNHQGSQTGHAVPGRHRDEAA